MTAPNAVPVNAEELAELRRDAARLDALERMRASIYQSQVGRHWVVVNETAKTRMGSIGKTLRNAIDAAMEKL